jgi:choline dehydrogenase-like flavoprotein
VKEKFVPEGCIAFTLKSIDDRIDTRVKTLGGSLYHPAGSAGMGKVVDADLKVYSRKVYRIADTSVIPASITGHYQVADYATAEQAADINLKEIKQWLTSCFDTVAQL